MSEEKTQPMSEENTRAASKPGRWLRERRSRLLSGKEPLKYVSCVEFEKAHGLKPGPVAVWFLRSEIQSIYSKGTFYDEPILLHFLDDILSPPKRFQCRKN